MLRLLTLSDTPEYQKLRLLSLQTDPLAFLSSFQKESTYPLSFFENKIRYAGYRPVPGYATQPPIFGVYGYFKALKEPQSAKATGSRNGFSSSLHEAALRRRRNSTLIATAQLSAEYHQKMHHLANIYDVYVHPDHRHRGLATKLLQHLISQAKTYPTLEQLHLRVNSLNQPAIKLYKTLGFTHLATRPHAVKEEVGTYQDELLFLLTL